MRHFESYPKIKSCTLSPKLTISFILLWSYGSLNWPNKWYQSQVGTVCVNLRWTPRRAQEEAERQPRDELQDEARKRYRTTVELWLAKLAQQVVSEPSWNGPCQSAMDSKTGLGRGRSGIRAKLERSVSICDELQDGPRKRQKGDPGMSLRMKPANVIILL